ncbi:MAG: phosphoethanolamine transferase domain-containing protein, partial [Pseudorhizobium sp.]
MAKTIATLRPTIRSEVLSAAVAAYLLFVMNATFWQKSMTYLDGQYLALAALALGLLAGFIALCVTFSTKYLIKPFLILLILSSAIASWSMDRFGVIIDREMIRNGIETNSAEVSHLITPGLIFNVLFFGVLPSLLVIWVRVRHREILGKVGINLLVIVPCVIVLGGSALVGSRPFLFNSRQHQDWFRTLNPIFPIGSAIDFAFKATKDQSIVLQPLGTDAGVTDALPSAERRPRVTIVMVGETA